MTILNPYVSPYVNLKWPHTEDPDPMRMWLVSGCAVCSNMWSWSRLKGTKVLVLPHNDMLYFNGEKMSQPKVGVIVKTKEKEDQAAG